MKPYSKLERLWTKFKCFLGFHEWVTDEEENKYCWWCEKKTEGGK